MKLIDVAQGSPEWIAARLGRPTASGFDRIITPTGKASAGVDGYIAELLGEWLLGRLLEDYKSPSMVRGTELEKDAFGWYNFNRESLEPAGLCLTDDELAGASPDAFAGKTGLVEFKNPSLKKHLAHVENEGVEFLKEHRVQLLGQLYVTEREWVDLVSYNPIPNIPRLVVRQERDEEFIGKLAVELRKFTDKLEAVKRKYAPLKSERDKAMAAAMETADTGPF